MTRIAAADIGATNARFRIVDDGKTVSQAIFPTADHDDGGALIREALGGAGVEACCIAVAGPVVESGARTTNTGFVVNLADVEKALGIERIAIVNDLVALGTEAPYLDDEGLAKLDTVALGAGTRAVIAPGTGLGMAMILDDGHVLPSEGGHAPFAPADPLEQEALGVLAARLGHVCWEDVLSGPGLENLHGAVSAVWGVTSGSRESLRAAEITERAVALADPICHQTLEMYCAILGSAAGTLCLTSCARGGLYLGGGIVPRIVEFLSASGFRRRFEERGRMSDYVKAIGCVVIMDDEAGLAGAIRYAWSLLSS